MGLEQKYTCDQCGKELENKPGKMVRVSIEIEGTAIDWGALGYYCNDCYYKNRFLELASEHFSIYIYD